MADYKIVKHCRLCKVRYVVARSESKKNYCDRCQQMMYPDNRKEVPQ